MEAIRNRSGWANFGDSDSQMTVGEFYGYLTHTYSKAGQYRVMIEIGGTCFDPKGETVCVAKGSASIKVQ